MNTRCVHLKDRSCMWFVKDNQASPYRGHRKPFPVVLNKRIFIVQVFINFWTVMHGKWKLSQHLAQLQVFITPIRILRRIYLHFGRLLADTFVVRSTYWVTKIKMIAITSSVFDIKFFISSFGRAFKVMKNGVYFILCLVIQDFGLYKSDDLWRHIVDTQWCKITKFGISVQMLGVQGWNFAGLICCKNYTC